ncbi:chemotaxis protein CheB [Ectothiorhodospira lacustris]|uniref:chemotaxis protein CheB n=1 Tax=Ectothiorhodospira lacustris TaxID=2899127 RepID=UPI001EE85F38|nr:chemotaxis protein CheB [Ectothiorhodospira lacustris]MCG5499998.1 PAS domain-containing protein [Ectothiorhodospira lacustris]MCG5510968.1 PAS domain-containing protein [Ectothiorhodospira lacustris]MCG5522700.1 PAS domain-containing protein [Ectothiorhodospira lacustris]
MTRNKDALPDSLSADTGSEHDDDVADAEMGMAEVLQNKMPNASDQDGREDDPEAREGSGEPAVIRSDFSGHVVGIGASAGGLEALEQLFDAMPTGTGAAFVVVQHLSPDHKSLMANLLARHTSMPVVTVRDAMEIEAETIYLIPPGNLMTISEGQLRLSPKNPKALSLPIDLFFSSLAREFRDCCIGVILSGTGSDGTRGSVAINDAGGLLLAQDPESAKFDGMPRSVIATGLVDEILPAETLGRRIKDHILQKPETRVGPPPRMATDLDNSSALEGIFHLLHNHGGVNFREYKPATVLRRIERRMQVRHVPDFERYLELLENDAGEVSVLRREILIPVTNFFRDPEAFDTIASKAVEQIVQQASTSHPIRVWVAGMSTGEEAYSIAILFAEAFDRARRWPDIKIFATDVEQKNVDAASAGTFSEAIMAEVSPERLERFFIKRGSHFVVKPDLRQTLVFARHNLLEDPPFTRMDMVSCRNVLIYFVPGAQERALRRFQYALAPGGYLFLGSSESLAGLSSDFTPVNSKHKLFQMLRSTTLPLESHSGSSLLSSRRPSSSRGRRLVGAQVGQSLDASAIDAAQQQLLRDHAPPSILLSETMELVHIFGLAQRYLHFPSGSISLEISKLLPSGIVPVAQALLRRAAKSREPVRSEASTFRLPDGSSQRLCISAQPLVGDDRSAVFMLLSFEPLDTGNANLSDGAPPLDVNAEAMERIQSLEQELAATRESLQATIEELEASNEELQATNEEMMAANEELQSSNEELQSVNEELYTVNAENQEKIQILNRLNADLDGMAKAASIATLFLDESMRITRFTPEATQIFKIRDGDVGRPIDDFTHSLHYPGLMHDLRTSLREGGMQEHEVNSESGRHYLLRILPYTLQGASTRGAVITLVDITSVRDVALLQAVLDSLDHQVAVIDNDGIVLMINKAWHTFAERHDDRTLRAFGVGANYLDACKMADDVGGQEAFYARKALQGLQGLLKGKLEGFGFEYPCHSLDRQRWFLMHAGKLRHPDGGAIVSHLEITDWIVGREEDSAETQG